VFDGDEQAVQYSRFFIITDFILSGLDCSMISVTCITLFPMMNGANSRFEIFENQSISNCHNIPKKYSIEISKLPRIKMHKRQKNIFT